MTLRDPRDWMWAEAMALMDKAERLHRQFFRQSHLGGGKPTWQPPVDVVEAAEAYVVVVALPGVPAEQVQVSVEGGLLVVAGERGMPCEMPGAHIHRLEIPYGRFERRVELPPGPLELARQELAHGCLVLAFRKL